MNMLIDLLPEYVELGGAEYPINTDFRVSILFELMMEDASVPEEQKYHFFPRERPRPG